MAAVLVPMGLFAVVARDAYQFQVATARERLSRTADLVQEHAVKVFETQVLATRVAANAVGDADPSALGSRRDAIYARLRELPELLDQIRSLGIVDSDGRPVVSSLSATPAAGLSVTDRDYFQAFARSELGPDDTFITSLLPGRATGNLSFNLVTRLPGAEFRGVIVTSMDPDYFQNFYARVAHGGYDVISMARLDGTIISRYPALREAPRVGQPTRAFTDAVKINPIAGYYDARSYLDGTERVFAYRLLPEKPLYVVVGLDRSRITADWLEQMGRFAMLVAPATLALLLLSLFAVRALGRERQALSALRQEVVQRAAVEDRLRQSQKMEAVGRLTGGVAHDFNNLLTIVIGNLERLRRFLPPDQPQLQRMLENAATGASRAANLTQRLLAFSRQQPLQPVVLDANKLVAGMSELLRRTLGENIAVETVLAGGLWRCEADANQLEAALLNLAVNARDAMPDGGRLTIETANIFLDDAYAASRDDVQPGQYVMLAVADTGTGIAPAVLAQVFEPFFTTKPVGQGTGLGLSQVHGFVKQSGGHVGIYSELGQGTTVKLYLPRIQAGESEAASASDVPAAAGRGRVVLVVEDDELVRNLAVSTLADAGYAVLAAENGDAALPLLDRHAEIALLFTDVVLTGTMNGRKLADAALARRPDLKVLFTTGYTRNAIVHHGRLDEGVNYLGKPYGTGALLAAVQRVLES